MKALGAVPATSSIINISGSIRRVRTHERRSSHLKRSLDALTVSGDAIGSQGTDPTSGRDWCPTYMCVPGYRSRCSVAQNIASGARRCRLLTGHVAVVPGQRSNQTKVIGAATDENARLWAPFDRVVVKVTEDHVDAPLTVEGVLVACRLQGGA